MYLRVPSEFALTEVKSGQTSPCRRYYPNEKTTQSIKKKVATSQSHADKAIYTNKVWVSTKFYFDLLQYKFTLIDAKLRIFKMTDKIQIQVGNRPLRN